jgi:outer membrane protein OmpA-like peptidoglycan-associated protein
MNHNTLKAILAGLYLIISAGTPAWSGESTSGPTPAQPAQLPGHYPAAPPGYYTTPPGYSQAPGAVPRPGWNTGRRAYPGPGFAPYGGRRPAFIPDIGTRPIGPPARTADSTDAVRDHLQAELDRAHEELQETRVLLEDAGRSLDRLDVEFRKTSADNAALDAELATTVDERNRIRERETELSIELMAAEKQLVQLRQQLERQAATHTDERTQEQQLLAEREAQLSRLRERLEQLERDTATHADERSGLQQRLTERETRLAELEALVESGNAEASGLRSELDRLEQQLALMKTEVQAAADALTQAQTETTATRTQRDEQLSRHQACQMERDTLATALQQERRARGVDQQALATAQTTQADVQAELATCNSALAAAAADLETAQGQIEALTAPPTPAPAAGPAMLDGDADGVADSIDLCPDSSPDTRVGPEGCAGNAPVILEGVSFRYDSHELSTRSLAILDRTATILRQHPSLRLEVAGHTDAQGNPAYNQWLSQQRAGSVRDYLIKQGVNPDMLTARGYGEQQPLTGNSTREGLARNRRVELRRLP